MTDIKKRGDGLAVLSDEEKKVARSRRVVKWKLLAGAIVAVVLFFAVMSVLAHLWMWAFGLLLVLGVGIPIYVFARRKVRAIAPRRIARIEANPKAISSVGEKTALSAAATEDQEIEDELAALKEKARR